MVCQMLTKQPLILIHNFSIFYSFIAYYFWSNVDINDFAIFLTSKFKTSRKVFCGPETGCCNAVDGFATTVDIIL